MMTSYLSRTLLVAALMVLAIPTFAVTNIIDNVQLTNVPNVVSGDVWVLRNGTVATNGGIYVGQTTGSKNSSVVVTGSGTIWSNTANLYLGYNYAQSNSIVVSSGAFVRVATGFNIADGNAGSNNTVVVTDPGSLFLAASTTRAGDNGYNNLLLVSNGGTFRALSFVYVGYSASLNQRVLVTGSNSLLDVSASALEVGYSGTGAKFTVSDRGLVSNNLAYLGYASIGASNASALVTDPGSRWVTVGQLYVGNSASYNTMLVSNGGYARVGDLYVGNTPTSVLNQVTIAGPGSALDSSAKIYVGGGNATAGGGWGNTLLVTDGGTLTNATGATIGKDISASNNTVVVSGTNSLWYGSSLYVGDQGANNSLVVSNAARVAPGLLTMGNNASSTGNNLLVSGALLDMKANGFNVNSGNNTVTFSGGAVVSNNLATIGASSRNNRMVVSGFGTLWASTNGIQLGQGAGGNLNRLDVSNGATLFGLVTVGAATARSNQLVISDGGVVTNAAGAYSAVGGGGVYAAAVNQAIVTGPGSRWMMGGGLYVGQNSSANLLMVSNGGTVYNGSVVRLGDTSGTNNQVIVTDPGSLWNVSGIDLGREDGLNSVSVLNGGRLLATSTIQLADPTAGTALARATNNSLRVSGAGSFASANSVFVGAMGTATNGLYGNVVVDNGGTLEVATMIRSGLTGVVSNNGGTFQFNYANPGLVTSNLGVIAVNNGTISFRNVDSAIATIVGAQFTNVTFTGANSFQLLSASNATGLASYTVDAGSPATTYQRLVLAGTNSAFRAGVLTIGGGGELYTSNSIGATVLALVTNSGTVRVYDSVLTYQSNVVVNGGSFITRNGTNQFNRGLSLAGNSTLTFTNSSSRMTGVISNTSGSTIQALNSRVTFQDAVVLGGLYYSDPSTNTFVTNVTVTASGALYGSNGDLFVFQRDLTLASTNRTQFNLANAEVRFDSGAGTSNHTLNLSGSGALDKGSNWIAIADLATNFAFGTLTIASGNHLVVQGDAGTNALYVGWLNLQGIQTNTYAQVTNGIFSALGLPNINLYYDKHVAGNDYLLGQTYSLWGGSLLIPIPEPTPLMAVGAGLATLAFLRRRRTN